MSRAARRSVDHRSRYLRFFKVGNTISDPRHLTGVRSAVEARGLSIAGFDFVVSINVDPSQSEGGFAAVGPIPSPWFVYMGNFGRWKATLVPSNIQAIAEAAYQHEIGHHWGWDHDWSPSCDPYDPYASRFITAPVLFGWEDSDGDGIPEILDPTPYGR